MKRVYDFLKKAEQKVAEKALEILKKWRYGQNDCRHLKCCFEFTTI